jgi:elongation factor G
MTWEQSLRCRLFPEDMYDEVVLAREMMVEKVAESDDTLTEKFLEGEEITEDELMHALRLATLAGDIVPVLCGSALKNKGVQRLLDAVVNYLPSPKRCTAQNWYESVYG